MELKLFHFSKRKNSTKQPADSTATATKNVRMKRETSVLNPHFLIEDIDLSVNYCKWNNNYYFVDDIILNDDDMYELSCSIDPLATAKSAIMSISAMVLYSANHSQNIIDKRIPLTGDISINEEIEPLNDVTITVNTLGSVILGLSGKGSFGPYMLSQASQVSELLDGVDTWYDATVSNVTDAVKQLFYGGSASENLKSAISIPLFVDPADISSGTSRPIYLGNYPCKDNDGSYIMGYKITKPIIKSHNVISIPWTHNAGDWQRNAPYTTIVLYAPLVGLLSLSASDLIEDESLELNYSFNVTSGDFSLEVLGFDTQKIIATASGNIAMPTAYGSTGIDTTKMTSAIVAGAAGIATSILTGGAAAALGIGGALAAAAGGTIAAAGGTGFGNGGLGGGASHAMHTSIHCYTITRSLTDTPNNLNSVMGKPYMKRTVLTDFTGFVQTEGFSLSGNFLQPIIDSVNSMMDAGVYLE